MQHRQIRPDAPTFWGCSSSYDGDLETPAGRDGLVFRLIGGHPLRTRAGIGAKFNKALGVTVEAD
jgi:hypothetical protein